MWVERGIAAGVVAGVWAFAAANTGDEIARERFLYLCVATLGYGHLLGAVWLAPRATHTSADAMDRLLARAFGLGWIVTGFLVYARLLELSIVFIVPFLVAGLWHTVENDIALSRTGAHAGRLPPLSNRWRDHVWVVLGVPLIGLSDLDQAAPWAGLTQAFGFTPRLVDLYGIPSFYHVAIWLLRSLRRVGALHAELGLGPATRRFGVLAAVHAVPVGLLVGLHALGGGAVQAVARIFYGPDVYLYLSTLHVAQTGMARSGLHARDLARLARLRRFTLTRSRWSARHDARPEDPS